MSPRHCTSYPGVLVGRGVRVGIGVLVEVGVSVGVDVLVGDGVMVSVGMDAGVITTGVLGLSGPGTKLRLSMNSTAHKQTNTVKPTKMIATKL